MQIQRIHIDGFGIFHDKTISGFQPGINILYGENEAGKSTLLDFFRWTLFGYPRFLDDRRPPLMGGKHGGHLWLSSSSNDNLKIYRAGDNSFEMELGQNRFSNDQRFKSLIGNATEDLYQNIYAFTLDELVSLDKLKKSGIEERVFSMEMGLSGVNFGDFEKQLHEEATNYYKPRGSTQVLIKLVNELEEVESGIHTLQDKLPKYNRLKAETKRVAAELTTLEHERKTLQEKTRQLENHKAIYEHFVNYHSYQKELTKLGEVKHHPVDYKEEFKELQKDKKSLSDEIAQAKTEINKLETERNNISVDSEWLGHGKSAAYFRERIKVYENQLSIIGKAEGDIRQKQQANDQIFSELGEVYQPEVLLHFEGTFDFGNAAKHIQKELEELHRKQAAIESDLKTLQTEADTADAQQKEIEEQLSHHSINTKEKAQQAETRLIELDVKLKQALSGTTPQKNTKHRLTGLALAGSLVLAGGALISTTLVIGIALIIIGLGAGIFLLVSGKSEVPTGMPQNALELRTEEEKLKKALETYNDLTTKKEALGNKRINEQKAQAEQALQTINEAINKQETVWKTLLEEHRLPFFAPTATEGFLNRVQRIRQNHTEIQSTRQSIEDEKKKITDFEKDLSPFTKEKITPQIVHEVIRKLEQEEEKQAQQKAITEKLNETQHRIKQFETKLERTNTRIEELYKAVGVSDEQAFLKHYDEQEKRESLSQQLKQEKAVIQNRCGIDQFEATIAELESSSRDEIEAAFLESKESLEKLEANISTINKEKGMLSSELKALLQPDEMYTLQSKQQSLQEKLKEETKSWMATKMAIEIVNKTKQQYERDKQPEVIKHATRYFKTITDDMYPELRISMSDRDVSVIDQNGKSKQVHELSRGTREQLLLAIRMGYIEEYERNTEALPVALDDILVNFDEGRAQNTARVLTEFAKTRQVILFTCHKHSRDLFQECGGHVMEWG